MSILNRKNWDPDLCAYIVRLDTETRRFAWWHTGNGERSVWIVQIMDNEENQIGDAEYFANRGAFPDRY